MPGRSWRWDRLALRDKSHDPERGFNPLDTEAGKAAVWATEEAIEPHRKAALAAWEVQLSENQEIVDGIKAADSADEALGLVGKALAQTLRWGYPIKGDRRRDALELIEKIKKAK